MLASSHGWPDRRWWTARSFLDERAESDTVLQRRFEFPDATLDPLQFVQKSRDVKAAASLLARRPLHCVLGGGDRFAHDEAQVSLGVANARPDPFREAPLELAERKFDRMRLEQGGLDGRGCESACAGANRSVEHVEAFSVREALQPRAQRSDALSGPCTERVELGLGAESFAQAVACERRRLAPVALVDVVDLVEGEKILGMRATASRTRCSSASESGWSAASTNRAASTCPKNAVAVSVLCV